MKLLCALIFMLTTHETSLTTSVVQPQNVNARGGALQPLNAVPSDYDDCDELCDSELAGDL